MNAKEFSGIRNIVNAGNIITHNNEPVVINLGNSDANRQAQQVAYETFRKDARRIKGGATHAYMNGDLKIRWLTIAKELGYYRLSKDELGNDIEMIGDIIIRDAGLKTNGDDILPLAETMGVHESTTSIFFVRWGERTDLTVLTSRGLVGRYSGQVGNFFINNVNMDAALVLQNKHALNQSKGWALSA